MRATQNYYDSERKLYSEAYALHVCNDKALKVLRKLCRHYNVPVPRVRFWGYNGGGSASSSSIRLSNNPSIGLIMHEFSHYAKRNILLKEGVTMENVGTTHHGTRFQSALNFVNLYSKSKGYWNTVKETPVQIKPEENFEKIVEEGINRIMKTTDDIIADKMETIESIESKIAGYQKRLHYFHKLYTTKIKKAQRSLGAHKRSLEKIRNKVLTVQ